MMIKQDITSETGDCCGVCGCKDAVKVTARIHKDIEKFLSDPERIFSLVDAYGSPLNILFPDLVLENLSSFRKVLLENRINGEILFTTKANRSNAILDLLANNVVTVDVSSLGSLNSALVAGIPGSRIQVSGPKNIDYLGKSLLHGCTISIDSIEEFELLLNLRESIPDLVPTPILFRLAGFNQSQKRINRKIEVFGINLESIPDLLQKLVSLQDSFIFKGFSFHISNPSLNERLQAIEKTLRVFMQARNMGLAPTSINIGGGFRISYAENQEEWNRFETYLKSSLMGDTKPVTWNGTGLGYQLSEKGIVGSPSYLNHYLEISGAKELQYLLNCPLPNFDNSTVGEIFSDALIKLEVEPGKAILDQAGVTLARVTFCKQTPNKELVVGLEMNNSNLCSNEQKLLTQPLFFPLQQRTLDPRGMFLVGNLCIPNDVIQYQKVYPGFYPSIGDLVLFINTGAYLMDFVESAMLHQPIARKVAVTELNNKWIAVLDDEYSAIRNQLSKIK